jgi:cell division protease FtsH
VSREERRHGRLRTLAAVLGVPTAFLWYRILIDEPINLLQLPPMPQDPILWVLPVILVLAIGAMLAMPLMSGRSPHVEFRPEQIDIGLADVKGIDPIVEEVTKTLNTFLAHALFRDRLGGRPRRGLLFEGPPGTGKTHLAKALARDAGVPFLFVSGTSFQSMWYGATARKIRSYFRKLRKTARKEGGAIGFIEEIDAIAMTRGGMSRMTPRAPPRVGRELRAQRVAPRGATPEPLHAPTGFGRHPRCRPQPVLLLRRCGRRRQRAARADAVPRHPADRRPDVQRGRRLAERLPAGAPADREAQGAVPQRPHHRGDEPRGRPRPALLRPGRFDRRLTFEPPAKAGRLELIDYFLSRKAHDPELDATIAATRSPGRPSGTRR